MFSSSFKTVQVLPLLKKPRHNRSVMDNCQSIYNLSTISKLLERLALNRLQSHLLDSLNFSRLQSLYHCRHSTETGLLDEVNGVYSAADTKCALVLVSLHISAAFNTLRYCILLRSLASVMLLPWPVCQAQLFLICLHSMRLRKAIRISTGVAYVLPCRQLIESYGIYYH